MTEITGDSPQAVALKLLEFIAIQQGKPLGDPENSGDKKWILDTYKECLHMVLDIRKWGRSSNPFGCAN
jgi:hypothetical protein